MNTLVILNRSTPAIQSCLFRESKPHSLKPLISPCMPTIWKDLVPYLSQHKSPRNDPAKVRNKIIRVHRMIKVVHPIPGLE